MEDDEFWEASGARTAAADATELSLYEFEDADAPLVESQAGLLEEVMDCRTSCCASAKTYSGFPVEAREGTKRRNRHSFLVNPFYIPL